MTPVRHFDLGDVPLQTGQLLRQARLAYVTFGELNRARDNAVLFPTYYSGTHADNARSIGKGRALDPERHFIVVPNLFGNGVSSSPSNHLLQAGAEFPSITLFDVAHCHKRLLNEVLGVERLALAVGWSMGAQQAYHFAALFPDDVRRLLAICGSAKTAPHNWVFLEGVKAALLADADFNDGRYARPPRRGLRAFGRVYAGWAYSQTFFRAGLYRELGYASPAALLEGWAAEHEAWDANDLLAMLDTWQRADISNNALYAGNLERALHAIRARCIVMPVRSDLYFPPEDSALEVASLRRAELRVIESEWGHIAGGPDRNAVATAHIERALSELLHDPR
ncbi:MAG TPA: alpha/beta fold hydrolase [Polyangiaceae bacterium]|nr:alpha/beta fold hydrolase [Polyangiaceae bacterium]